MDQIAAEVEAVTTTVDQFITSLQTSTRSAKRVVTRRKSGKQKVETDAQQKDTSAN